LFFRVSQSFDPNTPEANRAVVACVRQSAAAPEPVRRRPRLWRCTVKSAGAPASIVRRAEDENPARA
jgi:hypothetical protein